MVTLTGRMQMTGTTRPMPALELLNTLDKIPLFAGLTPKQIDWLRENMYVRAFPAGVDIITAGASGEVIYILLSGTVKVYVPQPDGSDVIVNILGPGDTVGEMSLVDQPIRSASVITLEDTAVMWMNSQYFREALQTMPVLAHNLLKILSARLRMSTAQIESLASLDVEGRVARQVLAFARRYGRPGPQGEVHIPIRLTQGEIAELVGASRKRVNQAMVALRQHGCLNVDASFHITVLDMAQLTRLSEGRVMGA